MAPLPPPEARARDNIDRLFTEAGWIVQSRNETNVSAAPVGQQRVRAFVVKLSKGRSRHTILNVLRTLASILKTARKWVTP